MRRAHACQAPRHDLAALGHELRQQPHVLVIDGIDLLDAKLADLLAAEVLASAFASARTSRSAAGPAGTRSATAIAAPARRTIGTVACGTLRTLCRRCCCRRSGARS